MTPTKALRVGRIACTGHGLCGELLPELIDLDEWGYPVITAREVPDHLLTHARRAAAACPVLALHLDVAARTAGGTPRSRTGWSSPTRKRW
ncbi:ferredoxin [Streptomyces scabiei]|uniref:ferredoxin n=1 Tax=Streptomyces scabiei TaxID=1930 RepID=UPI0029903B93|nr:ferredoxin [Streptomyces scabiei]MDW8803819.1 ferredoxin [Streptomyces scabiei]